MYEPPPQSENIPQWRRWIFGFYKYLTDAFSVSGQDVTFENDVTVSGDTIIATKTPASASATGTAGEIAWDSSYIYICTATDTWKRVAIATW